MHIPQISICRAARTDMRMNGCEVSVGAPPAVFHMHTSTAFSQMITVAQRSMCMAIAIHTCMAGCGAYKPAMVLRLVVVVMAWSWSARANPLSLAVSVPVPRLVGRSTLSLRMRFAAFYGLLRPSTAFRRVFQQPVSRESALAYGTGAANGDIGGPDGGE